MADLSKLPPPSAGCLPPGVTDQHGIDVFTLRFGTATKDATPTGTVSHTTNGDEARYPDRSGTYSKGLAQIGYGLVDPAAFAAFRTALGSADGTIPGTANFEVPNLVGGKRKLNGPLGAFAYTLVGADSQAFGDSVVPPPPALASPEYATELIELYWASLLRDVPYTDYETNAIAAPRPRTHSARALLRGAEGCLREGHPSPPFPGWSDHGRPKTYFHGEEFGPYVSQFCLRETNLGAQPFDQKMQTLAEDVDYLTDLDAWHAVQNGAVPLVPAKPGGRRFMNNGRALAAFTHVDELYQAYLTAYLVMNTLGIKPNPTNPYVSLRNQQSFGTFGGPDIAATLGAVARTAINAVWYQKWIVHLRHRPESGGGIVHLMKTGRGGTIQGHVDQAVLDSLALQQSQLKYGSYLLSQTFPEGSPAHPAYPTGHGTVAGACITVLKFFFDGRAAIPDPMVPSRDGQTLEHYHGPHASNMTVNGELHKLAHNISFGHGIHAGIHWRSDTDYSILLGEAVALSFLQDQAFSYQEPVAVTLTKLDGASTTIQNF